MQSQINGFSARRWERWLGAKWLASLDRGAVAAVRRTRGARARGEAKRLRSARPPMSPAK